MTDPEQLNGHKQALEKLDLAIKSNVLPEGAQEAGQKLLERLSAPVRVVIVGNDSRQMCPLAGFIAGTEIPTPNGLAVPLRVEFADREMVEQIADDGTVSSIGHDLEALDQAENLQEVLIGAPVPILRKINVRVVPLVGSDADMAKTVKQATELADIMIWCSQTFDDTEQTLWASVPDALKDHSYFVLPGAGKLAAAGTLAKKIEDLQDTVAEEFHSLVPIAAEAALQAMQGGDVNDETALIASGGRALIDSVMNQVELGRQSDADNVLLFLNRHGVDKLMPLEPTSKNGSAPAPEPEVKEQSVGTNDLGLEAEEIDASDATAKAATAVGDDAQEGPATEAAEIDTDGHGVADKMASLDDEDDTFFASERAESVEDIDEIEDADENTEPTKNGPTNVSSVCDLSLTAYDYIETKAAHLMDYVEQNKGDASAEILEVCAQTTSHLADVFMEDTSNNRDILQLQSDLMEAADVIVLMQMEKGDGPAADALTLLLQLRRDMEARIAA